MKITRTVDAHISCPISVRDVQISHIKWTIVIEFAAIDLQCIDVNNCVIAAHRKGGVLRSVSDFNVTEGQPLRALRRRDRPCQIDRRRVCCVEPILKIQLRISNWINFERTGAQDINVFRNCKLTGVDSQIENTLTYLETIETDISAKRNVTSLTGITKSKRVTRTRYFTACSKTDCTSLGC